MQAKQFACPLGGTAGTLIGYYIVRYFSLWFTPENEKSFAPPTQAKQFACSSGQL